jgi:hypothetical protein
MNSNPRLWFWIEAGFAAFCGLLAVVTIFWQDWFEALTGYDPDEHDGSVEWIIVIGLLVLCALLSFAARVEWRRTRAATPTKV